MFRDMTIGKKIITGFSAVLLLLAVVGLISFQALSGASSGFAQYRELARDTNLAGRIQANLLTARMFVKNFILHGQDTDRELYRERWAMLEEFLGEAHSSIQNPERVRMIQEIEASMKEYDKGFMQVVDFKGQRNDLVNNGLNVKGPEIEKHLTDIMHTANKDKDVVTAYHTGLVLRNLLLARLYVVKFLESNSQQDSQRVMSEFTEMDKGFQILEREIKNSQRKGLLTESIALSKEYRGDFDNLVRVINTRNDIIDNTLDRIGPEIADSAENIKLSVKEEQDILGPKLQSDNVRARTLMSIVGIVAMLMGIAFALYITRGINKSLKMAIDILISASGELSSASSQVSASSQQLAEGASEQASSIEEISASLEEMTSMTRQNTENAGEADTMATDAQSEVTKGRGAMNEMSGTMEKIKNSSDETAKIIKTIDEIAFQTNLLALNAAVEAARAGEAGAGFAVVAEEVRNLAQRSAEAAKNTSSLIEVAQENAQTGVRVTENMAEVLDSISGSVDKVTKLVGEVSSASREQSQGISQVATAVSQMDEVVQTSAANAEETASASEEMSSQASELNNVVGSLVKMVGGAGVPNRKRSIAAKGEQKSSLKLPSPKKAPAKHTVSITSPEDIIPLDDDFEDF